MNSGGTRGDTYSPGLVACYYLLILGVVAQLSRYRAQDIDIPVRDISKVILQHGRKSWSAYDQVVQSGPCSVHALILQIEFLTFVPLMVGKKPANLEWPV